MSWMIGKTRFPSRLWNRRPRTTPAERRACPQLASPPSKAALHAAFYPETTPYFYYLHGFDKRIHYAVDYEEHKQNIENIGNENKVA